MKILESEQAVAFKLNKPNRILEVIPTAQHIAQSPDGKAIVKVPYGIDEARVLNNIGFKVPSPIKHHYHWPGRYTPFDHQRHTAGFLTLNPRCVVLNEIGTGKTQSALWAADYLIQLGQVRKVLILSPLSTLERVWGDAIFTEFTERKSITLYGAAKRRLKLLKQAEADFYIINHDGFPIIADECIGMFDLVIVDEAAVYRNPKADRFKILRNWLRQNDNLTTRLWLMTGTPTPNAPTDAWTLAQLVNNPFCPSRYTAFRDQVMFKQGMYNWLPRPEANDVVLEILQPAIRYTRDECFDLPPTIQQTREAAMTAQQQKHYKKMFNDLVVEVTADTGSNGGVISAPNEAVKLQKLVQIACGVAYDEAKNNVVLDCGPRVQLVRETIAEVGGKVIVFVPLTGTLEMLSKELSKDYTVAVVDGSVSPNKRNLIFNAFQHSEVPKVLLAHPATMAHGLTLTAASTIIWYAPITSNEQYIQANGRVERPGKKHTSNIIHIESTAVERAMYKRLAAKQKVQGVLLDLIRGATSEN